jgi:protein-S-isoprenylcysteine O-methyltransferase Ste14
MASLRRSIVVSVLFAVFGGPGFVLVYIPWWMTRFRTPPGEPAWQSAIAIAMILAGLAPLFSSMFRFVVVGRGTLVPGVPTERLVVSGLYRYVRNPMYLGVLLSLAGEAILFRSRDIVMEASIAWLATHLFILVYEEPTLARRYPDEYPRYKRNVPRWLPRLTPWPGAPTRPAR